jgi:hypothetical protein
MKARLLNSAHVTWLMLVKENFGVERSGEKTLEKERRLQIGGPYT